MNEKVSKFNVTEHGGINPDKESPKLVAQHLSAYDFVNAFIYKADVLEIGHGDGYGAYDMSRRARSVTAVDLFEDNVARASLKYVRANLEYKVMNATDLKFKDSQFDTVCSFQVIEHIPRKHLPRFVSEIKRVLKPGGKAFVSTLNLKRNQKPGQPYDKSPHHDKEFAPEEYKDFLGPKFKHVKLYGLYPKTRLWWMERLKKWGLLPVVPGPNGRSPMSLFYQSISISDFEWIGRENLNQCIDLMAVVSK